MSQFPPPEETAGTSGDELPNRDPTCRKEDLQLGRVCSFFPGPQGEFLESAVTAAPSRDEVLSEGRWGPPGSAWLFSGTSSEPQPTVQGEPPWGAACPSGALPLKSWLCLRIRTVIRCWTRDVPARKMEQRPAVGVSRPCSGRCGWDPGDPALPAVKRQAVPQERTQQELAISHPPNPGPYRGVLPRNPSWDSHPACSIQQVLGRGGSRHSAQEGGEVSSWLAGLEARICTSDLPQVTLRGRGCEGLTMHALGHRLGHRP